MRPAQARQLVLVVAIITGAVTWHLWSTAGVPFVEVLEQQDNTLGHLGDHGRPHTPDVLEGYYLDAAGKRLYPALGTPPDAGQLRRMRLAMGHFVQYRGSSVPNFARRFILTPSRRLTDDLPAAITAEHGLLHTFGPHELMRDVAPITITRTLGSRLRVTYGDATRTLRPGETWDIPERVRTYTIEEFARECQRLSPSFLPADVRITKENAGAFFQYAGGETVQLTTHVFITYHGAVRLLPIDLAYHYREAERLIRALRWDAAQAQLATLRKVLSDHPGVHWLTDTLESARARAADITTIEGRLRFPALEAAAQQRVTDARQALGPGWVMARRPGDAEDVARYVTEIADDGYALALPPGAYVLSVHAAGFRPVRQDITVTGQRVERDVTLTAEDVVP